MYPKITTSETLAPTGGIKLGRPVGSKKKNPILAQHSEFIKKNLSAGAKQIDIARKLKVHRHTVKNWIIQSMYVKTPLK